MIWGAEEIFEMNLFFPGNPFHIIFFPRQGLSKFPFFLESASQNSFCPGGGPPNFFSRFPPAPPPDH